MSSAGDCAALENQNMGICDAIIAPVAMECEVYKAPDRLCH